MLSQLVSQGGLDGLGLQAHEGRTDLRGWCRPASDPPTRPATALPLKGVRFEKLDLSHADLTGFHFFDAAITGCQFASAICRRWALWATDVRDTSFASADLREAVLGAWYQAPSARQGKWTSYRAVSFVNVDLRGAVSKEASYTDCDFSHARLVKLDFQSSSFVRCRFAGEVHDVIFNRTAPFTHRRDPNQMEDVDLSEAMLYSVEFRGLDLDRVRLPNGPPHLIVRNYRKALERAIGELKRSNNPQGHRIRAFLETRLKWAGSHQQVGVFNFSAPDWSAEDARMATDLLRRAE